MKNPFYSERSANLGLLLARVPVGAHFVIYGCHRVTSGLASYASTNANVLPAWMPPPVGQAIFYAIPFVQVLAGLAMVLGFYSRLAGFLLSLILVGLMVLYRVSFSGSHVPQDIILLGVTLLLLMVGPGKISLDHRLWGAGSRSGD